MVLFLGNTLTNIAGKPLVCNNFYRKKANKRPQPFPVSFPEMGTMELKLMYFSGIISQGIKYAKSRRSRY